MSEIIIDTASNDFIEANAFDKNNFELSDLLEYYGSVVDKKVTGWYYGIDNALFFHSIKNLVSEIDGEFCELGVAFGKSAIAISLLKNRDDFLYLYDLFCSDVKLEDAHNNLETYGKIQSLDWRIVDLMELEPNDIYFGKTLKFLHIDSCHQHTALLHDLNNFIPKMHDDGIVVVDDWNDSMYPGVNTAVSEFLLSCPGKNWRIFCIGSNKAYLCRKHNIEKYRSSTITFARSLGLSINAADILGIECLLLCLNNSAMNNEEINAFERNEYVRNYL